MKNLAVVAVAILFGAINGVASGERRCPSTIHNSYQCSQYLESELAKEFPTLFSRSGTQLVIPLANGKKKTYADISDEKNYGVDGKGFSFVEYYPEIGYGLVAVQYYEGGTYYLVNLATGRDEDILSKPAISPDKKRIAVANVDLESRYTPNVLSVFLLRPTGLVVEFSEKPNDWGPGKLRWLTNEEIAFVQYTLNPSYDPKNPDGFLLGTPKKLKRHANDKVTPKWKIE